jgi:signal transduction histidine kinase
VQDIAGLAFTLAPLADGAAARGANDDATVLRTAVDRLRRTVRDLRALLVELHPPHLAAAGLEAAIADLVSPLQANGAQVTFAIDGAEGLDSEQEALVYRVAQEAVRNVIAYADADSVRIELTVDDDAARLVISDDGRGFDPAIRERRLTEGHLGLSLVEELARDFGGSLVISSSQGAGTRVELEVPSR